MESTIIDSPIGPISLIADEIGLREVTILSKSRADKEIFPRTDKQQGEALVAAVNWLNAYFTDPSNLPPLPIFSLDHFTEFSRNVLLTLSQTEPCQVISYSRLATLSGHEGCARAVGSVMRRNPISILIPCHRVIKNNGSLGQYSGGNGVSTKRWLQKHEECHSIDEATARLPGRI